MSKRTDYRTPITLYGMLQASLGGDFAVDAAANELNHLCDRWYGPGGVSEDALDVAEWASPAFCNPPYSRNIAEWCQKFYEQAQLGNTVVALLPAKIETDWWYEWVVKTAADVLFLVGRVPFDPPPDLIDQPNYPPTFPSAVVVYQPPMCGRVAWFDWRQRGHKTDAEPVGEEIRTGADAGSGSGDRPGTSVGGGVSRDQTEAGKGY